MMDALIAFFTGVNSVSNYFGACAFSLVQHLPGWASLSILSAVLGVVIYIVFSLTANVRVFSKILDDIKANILAIFLFKDNVLATIRSEFRLVACSGKLLWYSGVPVLIMSFPLILILAQMAMWYQNRPLLPGVESALVLLRVKTTESPILELQCSPEVEILAGPVRIPSRREIYWNIRPRVAGIFNLSFQENNHVHEKTVCAGNGFMRLSPKRPGQNLRDILSYPLEKPLPKESVIQSIAITYPARDSKIFGTNWWLLTFCVVSMICALFAKPFIKLQT